MLQEKVKPMIKDVCDKIKNNRSPSILQKTWSFPGNSSLQVALTRDNWFSILSSFDIPHGVTQDVAQYMRGRVMLAPQRVDFLDGDMCTKPPPARLAKAKFLDDGILLPFSECRRDFTVPNSTLFHSNEWPMMEDSDPTTEWPLKTVQEFDVGPAKNDTYGKLYHYLVRLFSDFHRRLRSLTVHFQVLHTDARVLPNHVSKRQFDRIDVNNITDKCYLGIDTTLEIFGPLLKPSNINPHATLITLFVNAVAEMVIFGDFIDFEHPADLTRKALQYMPELGPCSITNHVKILRSRTLLQDIDIYFDRYMFVLGFANAAKVAGLHMKDKHTIIDPWPMRVSRGRLTKKDQEYFALLLASCHTGQARYVEWRQVTEDDIEEVN
ncbi:hypothetical protein F4804DRAFT_159157 [Jackrogersella minutella]|nr:hypothetical protein F4804DRAFT_159157 [Jackrogersella minutella]